MAALGLGALSGDVVMSLGTSGTVFAVTSTPASDGTGTVAGFADASGAYLPLVATLNASRPIDSVRQLLSYSWDEFTAAIDTAAPGSGGLTLLPFLMGRECPTFPIRPDCSEVSRAPISSVKIWHAPWLRVS
nr:hypothetical protein [Pontimonas sp.]